MFSKHNYLVFVACFLTAVFFFIASPEKGISGVAGCCVNLSNNCIGCGAFTGDPPSVSCQVEEQLGSCPDATCESAPWYGCFVAGATCNQVEGEAAICVFPDNVLTCIGFESPMDGGSVKVKQNRVLPFKGVLQDQDANPVTDSDITSLPVIQVLFDSAVGPAIDVTADALPAGQGTEGNQFEYGTDKWQFNLKSKNYTAAGTYTITMESGDNSEYTIDPKCVGTFVIE